MPASIAMKWLLNVWIALSAKLRRCVSGGTSCKLQFSLIAALTAADASLSKMCNFGFGLLDGRLYTFAAVSFFSELLTC